MALILSIDTATATATVCIGNAHEILGAAENNDQKSHASFLQPAIKDLLQHAGISLEQIDAVAVSAGPGSYTGLRVGLASAKGLCYAMNKPLIMLNTLAVMAKSVAETIRNQTALYCPMIDARRMEVFAALYDFQLNEIITPGTFVLEENNFREQMEQQENQIIFFGSGMPKWKKITSGEPFIFIEKQASAVGALNLLAQQSFAQNRFADIAYSEPNYYKPFFTTAKIKSGI